MILNAAIYFVIGKTQSKVRKFEFFRIIHLKTVKIFKLAITCDRLKYPKTNWVACVQDNKFY